MTATLQIQHRWYRRAPWLLALAVATCTQDNVGPSRGGVGYFAFRPVYPMASGMSLSQFGIVADSVHIVLTRPVDELVAHAVRRIRRS